MRILLVEDDRKIAEFLLKGLTEEGFRVDHAENGVDGFHLAVSEEYDAAIVDVMLPRLSGIELISSLRSEGRKTPVIVLSAKAHVDDRVRGLQVGADDYLAKPFALSELVARIQALVRRSQSVTEPACLVASDLQLDLTRHSVTRNGRKIELQPREYALLEFLLRNKGRVVSKSMIMEHVWGYDFDPHTNVVESRISRLREKIDVGEGVPLIRTVRGVGYVLSDE
jgi:two-component system OmpR family response regulator